MVEQVLLCEIGIDRGLCTFRGQDPTQQLLQHTLHDGDCFVGSQLVLGTGRGEKMAAQPFETCVAPWLLEGSQSP